MFNLRNLLLVLFCWLISFNVFAATSPQKLTVILDWFANPDHAPLFVAQQQGFFKEQGLDVSLIGPANPADPPKLVAAGKADIALTYQPQLLLDVQQGLPLVRVGTLINSPLGCLAVDAKSNIHSLADLKGKTIGYSTDGVDSAMLQAMLSSVGLQTKDVTLINVNYDLTQALLAHRVDAVTGVQRNFEIIQMQLAGFPVQAFYPEQHGVPPYDELIYVTNQKEINDPRLPAFLRAVQAGENYLQAHPEQSWEIFAKNHPELNNELNKQAWFASLKSFAQNPADLDQQRYQNFAAFMQQQGLIKTRPQLSNYAVQLKI